MVGDTSSAGINRHVVGNERVLQERRTATPYFDLGIEVKEVHKSMGAVPSA